MAIEGRAEALIVDADPEAGREILAFLEGRGYIAEWVDNGEKAFNRLDSRVFDVLVTGLNVQRVDGMRLMAVAKGRNPEICVVVIAEKPDIELATEAMRQGACDFQMKPLNLEKLEAVLQRGLAYQRLVFEQVELKRRLDERFGLGSLIGRSRQMVQVYSAVRQIGPTNHPVHLYGEAGTGKELVAQSIHNSSPRRDEVFAKLDCARLPESAIEGELFGNSGGESRRGRFELADKGTLYLEGIDALSAAVQDSLIAAAREKRVRRAGDGKRIPADVRLIAATHGRLNALAESGALRPELAAMLSPVSIEVPALRTRPDDIPLMVNRLLHAASERHGKEVPGIRRNALNLLIRYDWPGNLREIENIIEGMVATARSNEPLGLNDIPGYLRRSAAPEAGEIRIPAGTPMSEIERIAIEETMKVCGHHKQECAEALGIGLRTLYRKLKAYDIS